MRMNDLKEKTIRAPQVPNEVFVDEWDDVYNLHKILAQKGWDLIGKGAFGKVFANPQNPQWVLKVFADQGYYNYLEATRKTDNPHFPRVGKRYHIKGSDELDDHGNPDPDTNAVYACMIERLAKRPTFSVPLVKYLRRKLPQEYVAGKRGDTPRGKRILDPYLRKKYTPPRNNPNYTPSPADQKVISQMEERFPHLREALSELGDFCAQFLKMKLDLQPRNIMWRGDCPVFVDPVWLDN